MLTTALTPLSAYNLIIKSFARRRNIRYLDFWYISTKVRNISLLCSFVIANPPILFGNEKSKGKLLLHLYLSGVWAPKLSPPY